MYVPYMEKDYISVKYFIGPNNRLKDGRTESTKGLLSQKVEVIHGSLSDEMIHIPYSILYAHNSPSDHI